MILQSFYPLDAMTTYKYKTHEKQIFKIVLK